PQSGGYMAIKKMSGTMVSLAVGLTIIGYSGAAIAQSAQDQSMQDRMRIMQDRIDDLARQLDAMKKEQHEQPAKSAPAAAPPPSPARRAAARAGRPGG